MQFFKKLFTSVISTLIVVPVNLIIVTIFRKSKHKNSGIIPTKSDFIARQKYWRRITNKGRFNERQSVFEKLREK